MNPREPWGGSVRLEDPFRGGLDHPFRRTLRVVNICGVAAVAAPIVVHVEVAVEAEPGVQHERPHECPRPVSRFLQHRGERRRLAESERGVVADAMGEGLEASENRRMSRQRHWNRRECRLEAEAALGEPIERRRQTGRIAVGADAIRTKGVDRDEEHVAAGGRSWRDAGRMADAAEEPGANRDASQESRDERGAAETRARVPERSRRRGRESPGCGSGASLGGHAELSANSPALRPRERDGRRQDVTISRGCERLAHFEVVYTAELSECQDITRSSGGHMPRVRTTLTRFFLGLTH